MTNLWMTPWRTALSMTAAALETSLMMQKSLSGMSPLSSNQATNENKMRDAFHAAADVNLRRWGDTAEMLQNLPSWYRDMGSMPGNVMTDWFDAARRGTKR